MGVESVNKGIMPDLIDPDHRYLFRTGEYGLYTYWYVDRAGNYWRYTNAPEDHAHFDPTAGVPLLVKDQPMPHTAPQFFTDDGKKRHIGIPQDIIPEPNPEYDPLNSKKIWYEYYTTEDGQSRYVYLDADVRENPDMWVQYQLRVTDSGIVRYRNFASELFNAVHPRDRILGCILMLVEQGLYSPEELINATVSDISFIDKTVKLLGRKFICDDAFLDFLTSIGLNRDPDSPLFEVETVHGKSPLGINFVYSIFFGLRVSPYYLLAWHANQVFSRIVNKLKAEEVPEENVEDTALSELRRVFATNDNIEFLIDYKVKQALLTAYKEMEKGLSRVVTDDYAVGTVWSDLVDLSGDEEEFSLWLHAEPMHDVDPEEEELMEEVMAPEENADKPAQEEDAEELV